MILYDDSPMPFGEYKGKLMQEVPAEYLMRIRNNSQCPIPVKEYIEDNLQVLEAEIAEHKRNKQLYGIDFKR